LETQYVDAIRLRRLRVYGRHGADDGERERRQPIEIDVTAEMDLRRAGASDDLAATLDYAALRERLVRIVSTTSYALLERLATELLDAVFLDRRVASATITLSKPEILDGASPSVTLVRANPRYEP
jgi:7,8-dihydroneopterin aldolase/epimerase/oxygenase